jgi:hypothetical protein
MFALWTWSARATGAAPPIGDAETLALVVPTSDLSGFEVSDVDCALIEPDKLAGALLESPGRSVDAWRAWIAGGDPALPIAAHAVPDATGSAVTSAEHAVAVFRHTTAVAAELRTALTAELRPYQVRGVSWLREAVDTHGGAVLADEMGLGKTLQAIGYLVGRADEGPQVVVCPTSLVGNWAHEIARFAPDLRTMVWRGGPLGVMDTRTVVLTGYPTLRLHSPDLMEHQWTTAVFDEAQALKNPSTQVSKAARTIAADAKIGLTGTPVENRLEELWHDDRDVDEEDRTPPEMAEQESGQHRLCCHSHTGGRRGNGDRGCPPGPREGPQQDGEVGGHDQCGADAHSGPGGNQLARIACAEKRKPPP